MSEDFHVEQLHFHWGGGENNTVGSEHLLEGESFPLEVSFCFKVPYRTWENKSQWFLF